MAPEAPGRRPAWIFGAGGIGSGVAAAFLGAGWSVTTFDRRPESGADRIVDLADRTAVADALPGAASCPAPAVVVAAFGRVTHGSIADLTDADARALLDDNVLAFVNLLWALDRGGYAEALDAILVVSSNAALAPRPGQALYAATKAAVSHLVQTAALDFGRSQTAVVGVAPGTVVVERNADRVRERFPPAPLADDRPGGRVLVPEDVGRFLVAMLPSAPHLTGRTVVLDAGSTLLG